MKIEDARLVISAVMGKPYIATISKRDLHTMNSKREIPKGEFIMAIVKYLQANLTKGEILQLKENGKVVAEMTLL